MLALFILVCCVILGSAILSTVEAALLSLPLMRARVLYKEKHPHARVLLEIKEDIHITIAAIVIINNAINIAGSIFIGRRISLLFGDYWLGIAAMGLTFLVIVLGEVIPKTIGERYKVKLSLFFARPVQVIVFIFRPIVKAILALERPFSKNLQSPSPRVTEEEIKMMLKLGRDAGTVEMDEEVLCGRVFKLNDVQAYQIMKPIDQMYSLPANKMLSEVRDGIINSQFSRIAVYDSNPLDVIGVVQHRILLREIAKDNDKTFVKDYMSEPIIVSAHTKADALLEMFQAYQQHLFIVKDDVGKHVGLVTMEDVLEELFGEIYDEKDLAHARTSQTGFSR